MFFYYINEISFSIPRFLHKQNTDKRQANLNVYIWYYFRPTRSTPTKFKRPAHTYWSGYPNLRYVHALQISISLPQSLDRSRVIVSTIAEPNEKQIWRVWKFSPFKLWMKVKKDTSLTSISSTYFHKWMWHWWPLIHDLYTSWYLTFLTNLHLFSEAVVQRCSAKKVFLEISQNSQENTCAYTWGLQLY